MAKVAEIDGATLKKLLTDNGIDINDLSHELGYSRGYITESIRTNRMSVVCVKGIENRCKIAYEQYAPIGYTTTPDNTTEKPDNTTEKEPKPPYSVLDMKSIIKNKVKTQTELAEKICRSNSYISNWLMGKTEITTGDILNIASALRISPKRIPTKFEETEPKETAEYNADNGIDLLLKRIDKIEESVYSLASYLQRMEENQLKLTKYMAFIAKQIKEQDNG